MRSAFRLWLGLAVFPLVVSQCPAVLPPCRCVLSIYEPVAIVCDNAGSLLAVLLAIQSARGLSIDSLTIVDTAINRIPAFAFRDFTILRLVLNRNTLSFLDPNAFAGPLLDSLVELDLSDNNLGVVPCMGVPQLRNLRKLYLNRNRINQLQPNDFANYASRELLLKLELAGNRLTDNTLGMAFRPLKALMELSLETNALQQIPSAALVNQRLSLTNLNLGLNQISQVPVGALDFPNLSSLSLEFNGIMLILPQAFQGIPFLRYLYLTGNRFPSWQPEMFRFVSQLRTLGIGETPISVLPANAFEFISQLIRLEMSEAAVDAIEPEAFQRTPNIQAIVLNKNRLAQIRADMFQGLNDLYSIDVSGNRISNVEGFGFANLPSLSHLDISYNQLETISDNVFQGSFFPKPNDRQVMYVCRNPWRCDARLLAFREFLRNNVDIDIDKPDCQAVCEATNNDCPPLGTPLRQVDFCFGPVPEGLLPYTGSAVSLVGWIILAIIMTILLISICLMALVRYGMSHRRKKLKTNELQEAIFAAGAARFGESLFSRQFHSPALDIDLPMAHNLDDRPNYF